MRGLPLFIVVVGALAACSSVPDVRFDDEPGVTPDGGTTDGGTTGPCVKSGPEICDDGVDNDCNGLADCADPACNAGFQCVDAPPSGFELVGFSATARPSCPTGFGASTDVKTLAGAGAGTCACTCAPAAGSTSCSAGQATVAASDQDTCTGGGTVTRSVKASAAACTSLGGTLTIPNGTAYARATPPPPPAACQASTALAAATFGDGRTCAAPPKFGKGCPGSQVCAPKPAGLAYCAMKLGTETTCPAAYPKRTIAGTSAVDGRACNTCTCTPAASCTGTVTLYDNAACATGGANKSAALTSTCDVPSAKNVDMVAYRSTITGSGCNPAGFNPAATGSITWQGQELVCCK